MMKLPPGTLANISPPDLKNYQYFTSWKDLPFARIAEFDLVNAWRLCEFALIAYAGKDFVAQQTEAIKADGYTVQSEFNTETEYLFISAPGQLVIAFRGTEIDNFWGSVKDWLTDFKFEMKPDTHGSRIHHGFTKALDHVWPRLENQVRTVVKQNQDTRIWITGHSLGAGLATLAAYRATMNASFNVHAVYTYGSPRVGDREFQRHYIEKGLDRKTFRFRNNNDLVTRVPPFKEYVHVGSLQFIDKSGHLHQDEQIEDESGLTVVAAAIAEVLELIPSLVPGNDKNRLVGEAIADHAPTFYAMHLHNNLPKNDAR